MECPIKHNSRYQGRRFTPPAAKSGGANRRFFARIGRKHTAAPAGLAKRTGRLRKTEPPPTQPAPVREVERKRQHPELAVGGIYTTRQSEPANVIAYYRGRPYYKPSKRDIARACKRIRAGWPDDDPRTAGPRRPQPTPVMPVPVSVLVEAIHDLRQAKEQV